MKVSVGGHELLRRGREQLRNEDNKHKKVTSELHETCCLYVCVFVCVCNHAPRVKNKSKASGMSSEIFLKLDFKRRYLPKIYHKMQQLFMRRMFQEAEGCPEAQYALK